MYPNPYLNNFSVNITKIHCLALQCIVIKGLFEVFNIFGSTFKHLLANQRQVSHHKKNKLELLFKKTSTGGSYPY